MKEVLLVLRLKLCILAAIIHKMVIWRVLKKHHKHPVEFITGSLKDYFWQIILFTNLDIILVNIQKSILKPCLIIEKSNFRFQI